MLSDAMLSYLSRLGPGTLRLWAARKAAERGMHWLALRSAPGDPYVLAALGLFHLAGEASARDSRGAFGKTLAEATLAGGNGSAAVAANLDRAQRLRLAAVLAPRAPGSAAALLPEDAATARAACLLAADRIEEASAELGDGNDRETHLLKAHIALSRAANREGRIAWNAAFAVDGLAPPLEISDAPVCADDFSSDASRSRSGPTISVIVPYRDAEATLDHALRSLRAQSWRDLEIIAVDDGSSDQGPAIAARAAERDSRIVLLKNTGQPGVYSARNRALECAKGAFVTFLDADDWSPPERLARQAAAVIEGAAVSIANHVRIDGKGRPVAPRVFPLARPVPITLMIRREALLAAGLFEEVATGADSEMLGRLQMRFGRKAIARDSAILLVARWQAGSLSEAREGGLFGKERLAYRGDWMFRHARQMPALASARLRGIETAGTGRQAD